MNKRKYFEAWFIGLSLMQIRDKYGMAQNEGMDYEEVVKQALAYKTTQNVFQEMDDEE